MKRALEQSELEDLGAYLDGELAPEQAQRVQQLLAQDPAWQEAAGRLKSLDEALGLYDVPACDNGLSERIIANVRKAGRVSPAIRIIRWVAPLAAAAAIVLAVLIGNPWQTTKMTPSAGPSLETFTVENLDFFKDYNVLCNYDTLQALDDLDSQNS